MILNPHIHNEPHPNRLLKQLLIASLGLHLALFLFLPSTPVITPKKEKSISVTLSTSPKALKKIIATSQAKKKVVQGPRDVFPKIPAPSPVVENDPEPLFTKDWEQAEMPLASSLKKAKQSKEAVQTPSPEQTKEFETKPIQPILAQPQEAAPEPANAAVIEGNAKGRELIYMPITPPMDLSQDVTISLQFDVTAAGRVTNILPLVKGNPELEKLAMGLLAQYRFEAVQSSAGNQRGVIHFTITRRP